MYNIFFFEMETLARQYKYCIATQSPWHRNCPASWLPTEMGNETLRDLQQRWLPGRLSGWLVLKEAEGSGGGPSQSRRNRTAGGADIGQTTGCVETRYMSTSSCTAVSTRTYGITYILDTSLLCYGNPRIRGYMHPLPHTFSWCND
jgi:hypothetical protein